MITHDKKMTNKIILKPEGDENNIIPYSEVKGVNPELKELIDLVYYKHERYKWDTVWAVSGDEGKGKSTLAKWILHMWLLKQYGEVKSTDYKYMALDLEDFVTRLGTLNKVDCMVFDETDISSRDAMKSTNKALIRAYQVIRADRLLTVLVLPSVFDLDKFFRNRRCRGLFHVDRRGKYRFWGHDRFRRLMEINETLKFKNLGVTRPTWRGWFSDYSGPFSEGYDEMKDKKIREVRTRLKREVLASFSGGGGKGEVVHDKYKERDDMIRTMYEGGQSIGKISSLVHLSTSRVHQIINDPRHKDDGDGD